MSHFTSHSSTEFLKGANIRLLKIFQILRKIWVFECKNALFHLFWVNFQFTLLVFGPFCLRKTFEQKYWSRKKIYFKKVCSSKGYRSNSDSSIGDISDISESSDGSNSDSSNRDSCNNDIF